MATATGWGELAAQPDEPFAIVATRTNAVAPAGIRFELTGLTLEERLYDEILWDFEEDYRFESPPARARIERSSRLGRGYAAAHCFVEAGTWRVRAWHYKRSGEVRAADTVVVTITDPRTDPRYTRRRAICSLAGDFSGFEGYQRFTDFDQATDWLKHGDFRYLVLRDGERFPFGKRQRYLRNGSKLARSYTGTARPVLEPTENSSLLLVKDDREAGNPVEGASIDGIELINSRYDPTRLSLGSNPDGSGPLEEWTNVKLVNGNRRDSPPLTMFRTRTYGCAISISISHLAAQGSAFVTDCDFGGWYDYGVLGDVNGAILGSSIAQPEGTLSGPGNKTHGRPAEWSWLSMGPWTRLTDGSFRNAAGSNQQVGRTFGLRQRLQPESFRIWRARSGGSGSKPALDGTEHVWVDRLGNGPAEGAVFDETTGLWEGGRPAPGFDPEAQTYTFQPGDLDDGYHLFVQALTLAYADHGPARIVKMNRLVVAQNYMQSRGGWSSDGVADQPTLRLATSSGTLGSDQASCTTGNHFVGGRALVTFSGGRGPRDFGYGHRFDYNVLEATAGTKKFVGADVLPFAAQGNVHHAPVNPWEHAGPDYTLAETEIVPADESTAIAPVRFRNETLVVDRLEPGQLALFVQATSRSVLSGESLAVYAPNQEVDASRATNVVATAVPPRGFAPGDGHPWLGQALGRVPALDHRGQERPVPAAVGALEAFAPATLHLGPAARLGANGALSTSGRLTVVARLRRDATGRRALFEAPGGHALAFSSPGNVVSLAIAGEGGQPIIAHELSTVSAPVGDWLSIMLTVDLGDGVTGGLADGRSVALWIDGRPVWEDFTTGPARLADQNALAFFAGEAPASLEHWLWADGTTALDPAEHWDAFFDDAGRVRELGVSGQAAGMVPEVFVALRRPIPPGDRRAPAGAFALGHNLGRGGALAGSGWSDTAEAGFHVD